MKKEPFYFNERKYKNDIKSVNNKLPFVQSCIDTYYKIEGIPEITSSELDQMFVNTMAFLGKKIVEMHGSNFNGLELREDKLFEMFKKPKGVDEFLNSIQNAKNALASTDRIAQTIIGIEHFILTKNVISFKPELLDRIKKVNSLYFENDKQEKAHDLLILIAKNYNELRDTMGGRLNYKDLFEEGFNYKSFGLMGETTKAEINFDYITGIK